MTTIKLDSPKGAMSQCNFESGERIGSVGDLLDLMANCPDTTMVLDRSALVEAFFDLRSGIAGELLQKISNYRRRLVILGDFSKVESQSLRAFIRESNATGQVVFAPGLAEAVALLK